MLTKKRDLEEHLLLHVYERLGEDVGAVERGGVPRKWEGHAPLSPEELEQLRAYHRQAGEALAHVRAGGALEGTPAILWGQHREPG